MHHPNPNHADQARLHASHDTTLIAGQAAGDLIDSDSVRAQALLRTCEPCAELHADLLAIASATHALPKLARAPRDYRLDAAQAARLRRGSWLRAALRPFGANGFALKPIAAAFTSAGIAGLLVVTVLPALLGSAGAPGPLRDAAPENQPAASAAAQAPGAAVGVPGQATAPADRSLGGVVTTAASPDPGAIFGAKGGDGASATGEPVAIAIAPESTATSAQANGPARLEATSSPNPLLIGSVALLGVGLALFGLRFASRRLR